MEQRDPKVTVDQAFRAMILFLEKHYKKTNCEEIGGLLSDLMILEDGSTADPAAWYEWLDCLNNAIANKEAGRNLFKLTK